MGHLFEKYGFNMLEKAPAGTCPECAKRHDSESPHDRNSLCYQYKFYDRYGRWPTWSDAMEHCSDEIKTLWIEELARMGIDITGKENENG